MGMNPPIKSTQSGDSFILFYAKGPHDWRVDAVTGSATHQQNIYSDLGYYFITVNSEDGKRIQPATEIADPATLQISTFNDYVFYERETINLFATGRRWMGEEFSIENQQSFTLPFPNAATGEDISVTVRAAAVSALSSSMEVSANSQNLFTMNFQMN